MSCSAAQRKAQAHARSRRRRQLHPAVHAAVHAERRESSHPLGCSAAARLHGCRGAHCGPSGMQGYWHSCSICNMCLYANRVIARGKSHPTMEFANHPGGTPQPAGKHGDNRGVLQCVVDSPTTCHTTTSHLAADQALMSTPSSINLFTALHTHTSSHSRAAEGTAELHAAGGACSIGRKNPGPDHIGTNR